MWRGQQKRRRAIGKRRGVSSRDRSAFFESGLQRAELLKRGIGSWSFIFVVDDGRALSLSHLEGNQLIFEAPFFVSLYSFEVTSQGELILFLPGDLIFLGDVFRGLAIVDQRVEFAHTAVGEAPTQGAVVQGYVATLEGVRRLGHHPGSAGHALDPAGDEKVAVIGLDGSSSLVDRLQSGPAQTIDRGAWNRIGQPCEKGRVARDVAGILARLVGTAEIDVFDFFFVDSVLSTNLAMI